MHLLFHRTFFSTAQKKQNKKNKRWSWWKTPFKPQLLIKDVRETPGLSCSQEHKPGLKRRQPQALKWKPGESQRRSRTCPQLDTFWGQAARKKNGGEGTAKMKEVQDQKMSSFSSRGPGAATNTLRRRTAASAGSWRHWRRLCLLLSVHAGQAHRHSSACFQLLVSPDLRSPTALVTLQRRKEHQESD